MEQETIRLVRSADAREEWVEKQETKERVKTASRRAANTCSQQEVCVRKKEREIKSGMRSPDGKTIKKVTESDEYRCTTTDLQIQNDSPPKNHDHSPWPKQWSLSKPHIQVPDNFQPRCKVEELRWRKTQTRATYSKEDHELVPPVNLGSD